MADIFAEWDNEVEIEREEHSTTMRLNERHEWLNDLDFKFGDGSSKLASWGNPKVTLLYSIKPTVHNHVMWGLPVTSVTYDLYADVCQWAPNTTVSVKIVTFVNMVKRREDGSKIVNAFRKEDEFTLYECESEEKREILLMDDLFPDSEEYTEWIFVRKFDLAKKKKLKTNINVKIVSVICRHSSEYNMSLADESSMRWNWEAYEPKCLDQNLEDRKDSGSEAGEATDLKKSIAFGTEVSGLETYAGSESGASGLKTSTDSESGASGLKTAASGFEPVAASGQEDVSFKSSILADDIAEMYANPDNLADLILDMKDRIGLSGHRFILSARSPVLKKKIAQLSGYTKNQSIELEIPAKPMTLILHWMYTDKLHENISKLWDQVLEAAKKLEMRDLTRILEDNIMTFVNHGNMIEMYQNTKKRGMEKARKEIAKYIKENLED